MQKLVETYSARPYIPSGMASQSKFSHQIGPATNPCPVPSILSAAYHARKYMPVRAGGRSAGDSAYRTYWHRSKAGAHNPATYYAARAKEGIQAAVRTGYEVLQFTQVIILCCLDRYT